MKCKLEGSGPAILISCFGISQTENIKSIDYQYAIASENTIDITTGPHFILEDQILTENVYRPPLVSVQGLDNNSIFYSAMYEVFEVAALTLGIDPSRSSFAQTLSELSQAALALEQAEFEDYLNNMKELDNKFSKSSDGLVRGLKRISVVCDDVGKSFEDTTEKLTTLNNLK